MCKVPLIICICIGLIANKRKHWKQKKVFHECVFIWSICGLCLNAHWNFPTFLFLLIYFFVSVVFSGLQCITWHYPSRFEQQRISWKQFCPERSCQADKTFLLSFTLKCSFFSSTSKIHKAAKLLTCVREGQRDFCILSCPTMQNSTLFI